MSGFAPGLDMPRIDATIVRLGDDIFVRNAKHPTRPNAWLRIAETDGFDADPVLTAMIGASAESTPAFGVDLLQHLQTTRHTSSGPLLAVYEGVIDLEQVDVLGIRAAFGEFTYLLGRTAKIRAFVNRDGLPERIELKIDFDPTKDTVVVTLLLTTRSGGEPVSPPPRCAYPLGKTAYRIAQRLRWADALAMRQRCKAGDDHRTSLRSTPATGGFRLDLLLISALRTWFTRSDAAPPWFRAHNDRVVGRALRLIHNNPAHQWTVGSLAAAVGVSRAAFARRFAELVGEPPMAYLADCS